MLYPRSMDDEGFLVFIRENSTGESVFTDESLDRLCKLAGLSDDRRAEFYANCARVVDVWQPTAEVLADLLARAESSG